jgi:hypothetical protein
VGTPGLTERRDTVSGRPSRLLTALTVSLALAAPAHAASSTATDPQGDGANDNYTDLKAVKVVHRQERVRLNTRTYADSRLTDEMWHLVDTRGGPEPEFLVFTVVFDEITYPKPRVRVLRVDEWPSKKNPYRSLRDGQPVSCGPKTGLVRDHQRVLKLRLGRSCFKTGGKLPKRLRVNTFSTFEWGQIADSAPSWRKYGDWVRSD